GAKNKSETGLSQRRDETARKDRCRCKEWSQQCGDYWEHDDFEGDEDRSTDELAQREISCDYVDRREAGRKGKFCGLRNPWSSIFWSEHSASLLRGFSCEAQRLRGPTHAPETRPAKHFDLRLVRIGRPLTISIKRVGFVTGLEECRLEIDYDRPRFFP